MKRTAIVSDLMMAEGGAERVVKVLLGMYPAAELFTLYINSKARNEIKKKFPMVKIHTSIFQKMVFLEKYMSLIKPVGWIYWERLNLSNFDLVISSSHSFMSKNVRTVRGKTVHLSIIQTPPRYLYDEFCEWSWVKNLPLLGLMRMIDRRGADRADIVVANSENVRQRIKKYYDRDAVVVYPPVEVPKKIKVEKDNYYVFLSRLVKQKGGELVIKTCVKNNWPLIVIGDGFERSNLEKLGKDRVKFIGWVDDRQKYECLAGAKALIYPAIEEDFGMVAVEAMGMGIPVVGYDSGGIKETVVDGVTGVLFDDYSVQGLEKAIKKLGKIDISAENCRKQARNFGANVFKKKINDLIKNESKRIGNQ